MASSDSDSDSDSSSRRRIRIRIRIRRRHDDVFRIFSNLSLHFCSSSLFSRDDDSLIIARSVYERLSSSLFISLADDDDDVVFIIIARKVRAFVCILLQSVSNEVFALLLGILLTHRGNFLFELLFIN